MANKPVLQGGVQNYLGKQKQVTAPVKWKSSPDHPETELAYITKAEKDLLVKSDLHGSLKGGVNKGPSGIMSLNGYGSRDESQNVSGVAASAAERGGGSGADRREVQAEFQRGSTGPALAPGVMPETARDFRSAAIAAGAGQRVNPGFFDSRDVISPEELARAKAYARNRQNLFAQKAMRRTRGGGLMNFITGGGFLGNILRGLGRRFGLGKDFDEPTYDMRQFSGINPIFQNDLDNELALSTVGGTNTVAPLAVNNRVSPNVNLLAQPAYNLDGTVRSDAFNYLTDFDVNTAQFDDNNFGITKTQQFDDSPYGRINDEDMVP